MFFYLPVYWYWDDYEVLTWSDFYFEMCSMLSGTICRSTVTLFVCLCWTASHLLQDLSEDIAKVQQHVTLSSNFNMETELKEWRQRYDLVCKLIEHVDSSFGLILLIFLIKGFVTFISFSFNFTVEIQNGIFFQGGTRSFNTFIVFVSNWCYYVAIIAVCNQIRIQVLLRILKLCNKIAINIRLL